MAEVQFIIASYWDSLCPNSTSEVYLHEIVYIVEIGAKHF